MAGSAAAGPRHARHLSPPRPRKPTDEWPAFEVTRERDDQDIWPPSPRTQEKYRKFFYPPKKGGNPDNPMKKKVVCVDQQRNAESFYALRDWAMRLGKAEFTKLAQLNAYIQQWFDPCRSGFIGLGDFLCLWFKNKPLTPFNPSYANQLVIMGKLESDALPREPQSNHIIMLAAVASAIGASVLRRDQERTVQSNRNHQYSPGPDDKAWYGGWSHRKRPPLPTLEQDQKTKQTKREANEKTKDGWLAKLRGNGSGTTRTEHDSTVYFTPFLLYKLRKAFEKYDEHTDNATPHIRFGMVASFLHEIKRDDDLGLFFGFKKLQTEVILNDLVNYANDAMCEVRERALEKRQFNLTKMANGPQQDFDDSDVDWDPSEDDNLAGLLEGARQDLKYRRPRQAERQLQDLMRYFKYREKSHQAAPYFEEPAFNFCTILALLLKYMCTPSEQAEVLDFFNTGVRLFHTLIGKQGSPADSTTPRVLPVKVLLREFSHLEIAHPGSTSFTDTTWPCYAGPMQGAWNPTGAVPVRRKMPADQTPTMAGAAQTAGGAM